MGSRTFTAVQELLWYNCSPFCGLSTLWLMVCLTYHASQVCCSQSSYTRSSPQLTCASAGDTQTLKSRSGSFSWGSLDPGAHKDFFEPCKSLWQACDLILNTVCPSYCLFGASPLPLDMGYLFFGGIQHSPVNGCSASSGNFGVLTEEDELTSFYSAALFYTEAYMQR